jgi:hypothetical protein
LLDTIKPKGMLPVDLFVNKSLVTIDDHQNIGDLMQINNDFSLVRPGSETF